MARSSVTFRPDGVSRTSTLNTITGAITGFKGASFAFDVYQPAVAGALTLVMVHGGAWCDDGVGTIGQNRHTNKNLGPWWAIPRLYSELGFCVVNPDYTCLPVATGNLDTTYRQGMVDDQKSIMTWVRNNIATYNGDPNRVVFCGFSSSGHLGCLLAIQGVTGGTRPDALYVCSPPTRLYAYGNDDTNKNYLGINIDPSGAGLSTAQAFSPVDQWTAKTNIPVRIAGTSASADIIGILGADFTALNTQLVSVGEDVILATNADTSHARLDWDMPAFEAWVYSKLSAPRRSNRVNAATRSAAGTRVAA